MNILLAFIAFNVILIVHELGHYSVAKFSGVRVLEFSLFFGPKIFSIKRGDEVFTVRCVPAGAYVKLEGEEDDVRDEKSLRSKPLPVRMAIMAGGPVYNVLFAIVVLTGLFMFTGFSTTGISYVSPGSSADKAGINVGDRIISYDGKRVYHPMDLVTFLYVSKGKTVEVILKRDASVLNKTLAPITQKYLIGFSAKSGNETGMVTVDTIQQDMPAAKAGMRAGDVITAIDGKKVTSLYEIIDGLTKSDGKNVTVSIIRGGKVLSLTMIPIPVKQESYDPGFGFASKKSNIVETAGAAFTYAYAVIRNTVYSIGWLITGKASINQLTGPVGLFNAISSAVKQSPTAALVIMNLLNITAFLSIAIGIANLLPIPPADGSKLMFYTVEAIRRKPMTVEREASITMIGIIIMVLLFLIITYNDILRIVTGGG